MLNAVVTTTGWIFWVGLAIILAIEVLILTVADEDDYSSHGWATFLAMGAIVGAVLFTDAFEGARWAWFFVALAVYLILGVAWSFKEWFSYVDRKLEDLRAIYVQQYGGTGSTITWKDYIADKRPEASKHKQYLVSRMILWPFSFTWWVLTYPRHFFNWAYARLSTVYDRITASRWK